MQIGIMFQKELESRIQSAFNIPEIGKDLHFINRKATISWAKVVSADIGKIINESDYTCLKENISNVVNYDLDSATNSKILDPAFVKLFRLAQLTIEYLLYAQTFSQKREIQLSEDGSIMKEELEKFRRHEKEAMGEVSGPQNYANNSDNRKETHLVLVGNDLNNTFRCMLCRKVFLNGCYLYAHHQRRHSSSLYPSTVEIPSAASKFPEKKSTKIIEGEAEKIWRELERLRKKVENNDNAVREEATHKERSHPEERAGDPIQNLPDWTTSSQQRPEKWDDVSPMQRANVDKTAMEPHCTNEVKVGRNQMSAEEKLNKSRDKEVTSKKEESHFEKEFRSSHQEVIESAIMDNIGDTHKSLSRQRTASPHRVESPKQSLPEKNSRGDNGRLEAQERVWRGRLKTLADKSSQEIESLRKIIYSLQEKERNVEEEYQEKIEKLTHRLREQPLRPMDDKAVDTNKEEELLQEVPPIPAIREDVQTPPSSRDSTVTSPSPVKQAESQESPMNSSISNASDVRSKTSDLEYDSSDISTSPNVTRRMLPSDQTTEDEDSDGEMALEVFEKKLRQFNVNPEAKAMPDKVFKEKMEMLNLQRKVLKQNIVNYNQIKSNLEEKADARVSQKMIKLKLDKAKELGESPASSSSRQQLRTTSTPDRTKEFPSSTSSKESLVPTTSRSVSSSHSQISSGRTVASQSSTKSLTRRSEEDLPFQSRISVTNERLNSSRGVGAVTSNTLPKTMERPFFPGVGTFQTSSGIGDGHGHSSAGGSILRGLQPTRVNSERLTVVPSIGGYGSKSVSFAHDLIGGKVYRAV